MDSKELKGILKGSIKANDMLTCILFGSTCRHCLFGPIPTGKTTVYCLLDRYNRIKVG